MVSAFTPNKHIEQPANGDDVGTWDIPVNADWSIIDKALGGVTNINATGVSGTTVLTITQYQPLIINFSGVLSANVNYQVPTGVGGQWIINNATTGAFTLTISSGGGGLTNVVAQGFITEVYSDGTNIQPSNTSAAIPNNTVTNSKLALMASNTIKSNVTGGAANPADNSLTSILDTISTTQGTILYRDTSTWLALAPGTAGQVLTTGGAAANPLWGVAIWAPGSLNGLTLSFASTTTVGIAAGACRNENSGVSANMTLTGAITKSLSAWAAGAGNGALFSGTVANNTWYHAYFIENTTSGVVDAGWEVNYPPLNVPAGYNAYRRLGSIKTNGSAQVTNFIQNGDDFLWNTPVMDVFSTSPAAGPTSRTLSTPLGVRTRANMRAWNAGALGPVSIGISVYSPDIAAQSVQSGAVSGVMTNTLVLPIVTPQSGQASSGSQIDVWTGLTSQVMTATTTTNSGTILAIETDGWFDPRGRL